MPSEPVEGCYYKPLPFLKAEVDGKIQEMWVGLWCEGIEAYPTEGSFLNLQYRATKGGNISSVLIELEALKEVMRNEGLEEEWEITDIPERRSASIRVRDPVPCELGRSTYKNAHEGREGLWGGYMRWVHDEKIKWQPFIYEEIFFGAGHPSEVAVHRFMDEFLMYAKKNVKRERKGSNLLRELQKCSVLERLAAVSLDDA